MEILWTERDASTVPPDDRWLSAAEQAVQGCLRFAKRRCDWRLGRWAAKCALGFYLDVVDLARLEIRAAPSGAPEPYVDGALAEASISITHSGGIGACCVGDLDVAIGCDLETIEVRSAAFVNDYFTPEERALIAQADAHSTATVIWSAKESVLKAVRQGLRLDTRSVAVSNVETGKNSAGWHAFEARLHSDRVFHGWWQMAGTRVRTVCADPAPMPPALR